MLVVASATFDAAGRLMVDANGALPSASVQERTLSRLQIRHALLPRSSIFQWLYAVSWDWTTVEPFLDAISGRILEEDRTSGCANRLHTTTSLRNIRKTFASSDATREVSRDENSLLDFRDKVLDAAHRLSQHVDAPLSTLGIFYDGVLLTGPRKATPSRVQPNIDEETAAPSGTAGIEDDARDAMMFIVRQASHDQVSALTRKGYRFVKTRFLGSALASRYGVDKEEMDATLRALGVYSRSGTKPVVQPGGCYAGLFHVRSSSSEDSLEVAVYDFARHQIPAFRLPGVDVITPEMLYFVKSLEGLSMGGAMNHCDQDSLLAVRARQTILRLLESSVKVEDQDRLNAELDAIDALVEFQNGLVTAIKTLYSAMKCIPNLASIARLSSKMIELPSSLVDHDTDPAHLLLVHALTPADASSERDESWQPESPFCFTPISLFSKAQMMMLNGHPAAVFEQQVIGELQARYGDAPTIEATNELDKLPCEDVSKELEETTDAGQSYEMVTHILLKG